MRWRETLDDWHPMFCWAPLRVGKTYVWLERVERRRTLAHMWGDNFEYRLPRDSDGTATAALNEDLAVPQDCQARAESIARNTPQPPLSPIKEGS